MFYIYILYGASSDKYYVGYSQDPWYRLEQHNTAWTTKYTGKLGEWMLAAVFEAGASRSEAMRLEEFIKRQKSRRLMERLTDPDFVPSRELAQLVRVPHAQDESS